MRNKKITTLPLLVGLVAIPFSATADSVSDQALEIAPFLTVIPDNSVREVGETTVNLGDTNGDGHADFLVTVQSQTSPFKNSGLLYHGGPSLDIIPDLTFLLGNTVDITAVGDVNGDGYADIGLSKGQIVFGGPAMDTAPDVNLPGSGSAPQPAGDVNGDGFEDVIVKRSVFFGGSSMDIQADATFDKNIIAIGDINGDGYADLATVHIKNKGKSFFADSRVAGYGGGGYGGGGGSPTRPNAKGRVNLYYGGPTLDTTPDLTLSGLKKGDRLGRWGVLLLGDVSGDGFDDVAIKSLNAKNNIITNIFFGGPGMNDTPDVTLAEKSLKNLTGNFDLNQDGFSDVAAWDSDNQLSRDFVNVYFGGPNMDGIRDLILTADLNGAPLLPVRSLSGGRDVTGDGVDDLLVGAGNRKKSGVVYLFAGKNGPVDPPADCSVNESFEAGDGGWAPSIESTCKKGGFVLGTPSRQEVRWFATQAGGDHTSGNGNAWFTAFNSKPSKGDVNRGACILESPIWQVEEDSDLSLWYFHGQRDSGDDDGDFFSLDISTDGGVTFTPMVSKGDEQHDAAWTYATTKIPAGSEVAIKLKVADGINDKDIIEGGLDDVRICPSN